MTSEAAKLNKKERPIKSMVDVILYSRKKAFSRRQWYWRVVYNRPGILDGKILCDSGEGYNNRNDAIAAFHTIQFHLPFAVITCPEMTP